MIPQITILNKLTFKNISSVFIINISIGLAWDSNLRKFFKEIGGNGE